MRYGDLSNEVAPIVGVRFENIVYNFGKVNQPGKALCESILSKDRNLYFISTLPQRKVRAWCFKWGVPYTNVIEADSVLEIPEICFHNKLLMYYDIDERLLAQVGMRGNEQTKAIRWEQPLSGPPESPNFETN